MSWVAVAVAAGAALSAGASYAGSKKQGDASKKASGQQWDMFRLVNEQQQPFIQGGYGAMGKLNTLLGLGGPRAQPGGGAPSPGGQTPAPGPGNHMYRPTPGGGMEQILGLGADQGQLDPRQFDPRQSGPKLAQRVPNARLKQLLALRAANGDTEAARIAEFV